MPSSPAERRLPGASKLTFSADGTPLAQRMDGNHLFAAAAAAGELMDGVEERLPANPDVVVGGVSGRNALLARQQCSAAVRVHVLKMAAVVLVQRTAPRTRGAGRPAGRRRAVRSRAGPSGDADPHEPPPPARRPENLAEERACAATRLADADALMPSSALWSRVRNEADRRAEELRRG